MNQYLNMMNTTSFILYLLLTSNGTVTGDASLYFDCSDEYIQMVSEVQQNAVIQDITGAGLNLQSTDAMELDSEFPDEGFDTESDLEEEDLHVEPWMSTPFTNQFEKAESDQQ